MSGLPKSQPGSVLVLGAGGFIGFGVALAFRRAGYTVFGLIRKPEQARDLKIAEIIPVIGDGKDPASWKDVAVQSAVIVDCTANWGNEVLKAILSVLEPLATDIVNGFTSGIMVYGHDDRIRDETWPLTPKSTNIWRADCEKLVLNAKNIAPIVIRPGWVFGRDGGMHSPNLFSTEQIVFTGEHKDRKYSWIHIDPLRILLWSSCTPANCQQQKNVPDADIILRREDLGALYVAAAKQGARVQGEVFNGVGYDAPKCLDLEVKAHRLAGYKGIYNRFHNSGHC